jgi:cell division septum initiation protein DivIVA
MRSIKHAFRKRITMPTKDPERDTTDPTYNVRELITLSNKHAGELRAIELRRVDDLMLAEQKRVNEQLMLRADYSSKLADAEAKRIDAIRAVDVGAVAVASERANQQAAVLANQVSASAEALRSLVAATANTQAQQLATLTTQLTDRLTALEKSQYENKGSGQGMSQMYAWIFAGLMGMVTIGSVIFQVFKH